MPDYKYYGKSMAVKWEGIETVRANLRAITEKYPIETGRALREEGIAIMEESMRVCPYDQDNDHDDGSPHLNETGQVSGPYNDGAYDTPYAVIQHEIQEYHHDYPEQWKYLEHPLNARVPFLASNLSKGIELERMGIGYSAPTPVDLFQRQLIQKVAMADTRAKQKANIRYGNLMGRYRY